MLPTIGEVVGDKRDLRLEVLRSRAASDSDVRLADDRARTALVLAHLPSRPVTVAAYLSEPSEPGTATLVAELHSRGIRILLPVLRREPTWAVFDGADSVRVGRWGIPEPTGVAVGPSALAAAEVVILPGLAGTSGGTRLGRGGGWYDRALLHAGPAAPRILLLNDAEVVTELPQQDHDVPVTAIATPTRWLECGLGGDRPTD